MALSAILKHPAAIRSRRAASLAAGLIAALLVLAGAGVLLDLRQEAIDQREYLDRADKFDFILVDAIAAQGILLAPATVNGWSSSLHIGWRPLEVGPDRCQEQSYMIKKPGRSVFTHIPNDWYLCARAPAQTYALPSSMTSGYWLYPLQALLIGVILAMIGWKLWPRPRLRNSIR